MYNDYCNSLDKEYVPEKVPTITLGYSTFVVSQSLAATLLHGAATGDIREASRDYVNGEYKVTIKGVPSVQVEHLSIMPDTKEEIKKLKQRLQELEGGQDA